MDTSEEYINMCDCPEIQGLKNIKIGDFYYIKMIPEGKVIVVTKINPVMPEYGFDIWLPRQDQLQEMVLFEDSKIHTFWHFVEFLKKPYLSVSSQNSWIQFFNGWVTGSEEVSMEQLWLAFVMQELYNKKWIVMEWKEKKR